MVRFQEIAVRQELHIDLTTYTQQTHSMTIHLAMTGYTHTHTHASRHAYLSHQCAVLRVLAGYQFREEVVTYHEVGCEGIRK